MIDLKSLSFEELSDFCLLEGYKPFRAKQLFDWLHAKQVESYEQMTNLPADMIAKLKEKCTFTTLSIEKKLVSQIDGTVKYLYKLPDGEFVETVLMKYKHGNSVCLSTQVGCKMGCSFCASTKAGFKRNLNPSEILEQLYTAQRDSGERISTVVLMGIGEPLDNYDNVIKFLRLISDERGNNLSLRHLSLSTCGLVDKIYELAELKLGLTLSISLHAPNDKIREQTMPVNKRFCIAELIKACKVYTNKTGRRVSFEYALIKGVNDAKASADELANLLRGMLCHVNLIPVNEINETNYKKSDRQSIEEFSNYLNNKGITTTVRRTLGSDINAACGQLRNVAQNATQNKDI